MIDIQPVKEGNATVLKVSGRLDNITAARFDTAGVELSLDEASTLILDLSELAYISSAGLRSVLLLAKNSQAKGGRVLISGLSPTVKSIFEIAGFSSIFPVFENREEALADARATRPLKS